jgi:hypothetical protein
MNQAFVEHFARILSLRAKRMSWVGSRFMLDLQTRLFGGEGSVNLLLLAGSNATLGLHSVMPGDTAQRNKKIPDCQKKVNERYLSPFVTGTWIRPAVGEVVLTFVDS